MEVAFPVERGEVILILLRSVAGRGKVYYVFGYFLEETVRRAHPPPPHINLKARFLHDEEGDTVENSSSQTSHRPPPPFFGNETFFALEGLSFENRSRGARVEYWAIYGMNLTAPVLSRAASLRRLFLISVYSQTRQVASSIFRRVNHSDHLVVRASYMWGNTKLSLFLLGFLMAWFRHRLEHNVLWRCGASFTFVCFLMQQIQAVFG